MAETDETDEISSAPGSILPAHIAVVMDGNGRWAQRRGLARAEGHAHGAIAARRIVEYCYQQNIPYLTLFAFSSENWNRPQQEVALLMELFTERLQAETAGMVERKISLRVVGSRSRFPQALLERIEAVELATAGGTHLSLQVAADYGGRWDIVEAARQLASKAAAGELEPSSITEQSFCDGLALSPAPDPDLLIRTGGESRVSNFLLWQLAYAELYFTELCWPDFDADEFQLALNWFAARSRRFGLIDDLESSAPAEPE